MIFDPVYFLFVAPAMALSLWASFRTKSAFKKYSQIPTVRGLTGAQAAEILLEQAGISDVKIVPTRGVLSDHYNPLTKTLALSEPVYGPVARPRARRRGSVGSRMVVDIVPIPGRWGNLPPYVAYPSSSRDDTHHLYVTSLGGGDEELLVDGDANHFVTDWSADGRYVIFMSWGSDSPNGTLSALDLQMSETIPIQPGGTSSPGYGTLSPDGGWLAYSQMDVETGQSEIFITAFPEVGRRWRVSTEGGGHARWSGDGSEIFYVDPGSRMLMATTFTVEGRRPVIGRPQTLFESMPPNQGVKYAPAADGQRFLTLDPVAPKELAPLTLVWNWSADLDGR